MKLFQKTRQKIVEKLNPIETIEIESFNISDLLCIFSYEDIDEHQIFLQAKTSSIVRLSFTQIDIYNFDYEVNLNLKSSLPLLNNFDSFIINKPIHSCDLAMIIHKSESFEETNIECNVSGHSIEIKNETIVSIPFEVILNNIYTINNIKLLNVIIAEQISLYNSLNLLIVIEDICFRILFKIEGKSYTQTKTTDLFSKSCNVQNQTENRRTKKIISNNITDKHNTKLFDLILPALHPPLSTNFQNDLYFPNDLFSFQVDGIKFLIENDIVLLGDEMGLGKSIQSITAIRVLIRKALISKVCILCPLSVLTDWEEKFEKWAPELKVIKIEGNQEIRKLLWNSYSHIYICNYERLRSDIKIYSENSYFADFDFPFKCFDLIVFDEIQKLKNPLSEITKAARLIKSKKKWALSGTPLENGLNDLISVCETIKPNIFDNINKEILNEVKMAYKSIFLRRRHSDVSIEMPEKITEVIWKDLLPEQRKNYDLIEKEGKSYLTSDATKYNIANALSLITKLKLICNYDIDSEESAKLNCLIEKLDDVTENNKKAIVFSQYPNETLRLIAPKLSHFYPKIFDGKLTNTQRHQIINQFQKSDDSICKVLLVSLKAGGTGITLTEANYVYHYDLWWNPAVADQAVGRAYRIGQKKTVFETFILTKDTIEEKIFKIYEKKKLLFKNIVDVMSEKDIITKQYTEEEIFSILGLEKPSKFANNSLFKKDPTFKSSLTIHNEMKMSIDVSNNYKNKYGEYDFEKMTPNDFEKFVCDLFSKMGYKTKLTPKSNDGGIDIYAKLIKSDNSELIIIQCKRKEKSDSLVQVEKVRELYGVLKSNKEFSKAVLVTNGGFSKGAIEFAFTTGIQLIDNFVLRTYIKKYYI